MTRTVVLGTANPDKLKELRQLLKGSKTAVLPISYFGPVPKVIENGRTFEVNACKKARAYSRLNPHLTLADDSGLCVPALNGRPGVYSARFAGPGCTYEDNNRKLLGLLENKPAAKRRAYFVSTIAMYLRGRRVAVVRGVCHGRIQKSPAGKNGFGFDPVFVPDGFGKTFSQMSDAQKNRISHRGNALKAVRLFLRGYFRKNGIK